MLSPGKVIVQNHPEIFSVTPSLMVSLFIFIERLYLIFLVCALNMTMFDFETFNDSLLAMSHSETFCNSSL